MDNEIVKSMQHAQLGQKRLSVTINVLQARGLCSTKGESFPVHSSVRIHFLDEDAELDTPMRDTKIPMYNFCRVFERTINASLISSMLNAGLRITVLEGVSHKTALGTAVIDLTPLVVDNEYGRILLPSRWYQLCPSDEEKEGQRNIVTEVEVSVAISQPLLTEDEFNNSNLLKVKVDGAYSLPIRWTPKGMDATTNPFKYVLYFSIPGVENRQFCEGDLSLPVPDTEVGELHTHNATGFSRVVSTVFAPETSAHESSTPTIEEEHYKISEANKPRILWDFTYKVLLNTSDIEHWCNAIKAGDTAASLSVFELARVLKVQYNDTIDHNEQKYRGQILVDLKSLLSKGVCSIVGRFKVSTGHGSNATEFINASSDATDDVDTDDFTLVVEGDTPQGEELSPKHRGRGSKSPPKRERKLKKSTADTAETGQAQLEGKRRRKSKSASVEQAARGGTVSRSKMRGRRRRDVERLLQPEPAEDGNPYETEHTYVKIEITLGKPLVVKPPTPRNVLKPSDFIPKRAPLPHFFQLKEATEEYQAQIKQIVAELALEYRKLFGINELPQREQQKMLAFELNSKGKYFIIKEKLKKSVVRVVREKFQFVQNSTSQLGQLEVFLSELYVYLTEQMHAAIFGNTYASAPVTNHRPIGQIASLDDRLKAYAQEAEVLLKYTQAALYHQERVVHNKYSAQLWHDYGCFALRMHDEAKAEECFHESISLDSQHTNSLVAYGLLMFEKGDMTKSEVFLQSAVTIVSTNTVLLGLLEFLKLDRDPTDFSRMPTLDSSALNVQVAQYLLDMHFPSLAERVLESALLQHETGNKPVDISLLYCKALIHTQKADLLRAEEALEHLLTLDNSNLLVWTLVGDVYYRQKQTNKALKAYQVVLNLLETNESSKNARLAALLRIGELHTSASSFEEAKEVFLEACVSSPASPYAWLGAGIAFYEMGSYNESEDALAEANILNNHDAHTWGYLTLLCFRTNRLQEANQALKQAFKLHLSDATILYEIGKCYVGLQKRESYIIAEKCLRTALHSFPDPSLVSKMGILLDSILQYNVN